jgi:hypothetical protein
MNEAHHRAAEQHELAAHAHRTAAEHNERGDNPTGNWHSYELAKDAHNKSGQIESL